MQLMVRHRATRVRTADGTEVELHPSAFGPTAPAAAAGAEAADPDVCLCTHSIGVDHNELGCLRGCSTLACTGAGARA
jgi:hypothetical protein